MGSDNRKFRSTRLPLSFNPRSPRGERRSGGGYTGDCDGVSNPRSPRGEATLYSYCRLPRNTVSIHAPRVGSDGFEYCNDEPGSLFQSTLPAWGATLIPRFLSNSKLVSIHAPRVGSDGPRACFADLWFAFQSTLPAWGATIEGRTQAAAESGFNPRSPRGERRPKKSRKD